MYIKGKSGETKNLTIKNIMENLNKLNKQESQQEGREENAEESRQENQQEGREVMPKHFRFFSAQDLSKQDLVVRQTAALSVHTLPEAIAVLAKDKSEYVRQYVAGNPNTSPEILTSLAEDENDVVRWHVAGNLNTPAESTCCTCKG